MNTDWLVARWSEIMLYPELDAHSPLDIYTEASKQGLTMFDVDHARAIARARFGLERIQRAAAVNEKLRWKDLRSGFPYYDRNDLPYVLSMAHEYGRLATRELAAGLEEAWTSAEWPERLVDSSTWMDMFETVGFLENAKRTRRPTRPITLYRGAIPEHMDGMSWTDNPERALWFAKRFPVSASVPQVYTIVVDPVDVYAHFTSSRDEDEWVMNPLALVDYYEPRGHDIEDAEARWGLFTNA